MDLNLYLKKELIWVLQLDSMKDIMMASLLVQLTGYYWDEKTELYWNHQMNLKKGLSLGLTKERMWVI